MNTRLPKPTIKNPRGRPPKSRADATLPIDCPSSFRQQASPLCRSRWCCDISRRQKRPRSTRATGALRRSARPSFFRRAIGAAQPWTDNPVLAAYKFTNAYRASDRVSQYLIRHVIYRDDLPKSPREVFFRILLFKLFNKIATWELLEHYARHDHVRGLSLFSI